MPRMFRIMKKDSDDKPTTGQTTGTLGIRPGEVDLDAFGNVIVNDKGMSVNPDWRVAPISMIPKRLGTGGRDRKPGTVFDEEPARSSRPRAGPGWNFCRTAQLMVW